MVGRSLECAVMMRALSDPVPADSRHSPEAEPGWVWGLSGRRILVAALLGVALGLGASASNAWPSALIYVLNAGWAWAGVMVVGGLFARTPLGGMVTALVAAAFANTAYYLGDSWWAGASRSGVVVERDSFMSALPEVGFWILVALVLAPGLGAVGALQRRRDLWGLLAVMVVPVGASVEMLLPRRWAETTATEESVVRWLVWIASAALITWALRRYMRWRGRKDMHDDQSHPRHARSQVAVTAILVVLSLAVGIAVVIVATGVLSPVQRGAGLTDTQKGASIIARVEVVDEGPEAGSARVTLTRAHTRDGADLPDFEFEIDQTRGVDWQAGNEYVVFLNATEPPRTYQLIPDQYAAIPIDEQGTVAVGLPDWLKASLDVQSP